ncbi:MAG: hypothetical protein V7K41_17565 [Nostoc sp.]|uniref:hypothetical protein n=1 Tax=Nostoc sp. TaxID=1180 RepID=UPI002FFAB8FA
MLVTGATLKDIAQAIALIQTQLWLSSLKARTRFTFLFSHGWFGQGLLGWFSGFGLGSFGCLRRATPTLQECVSPSIRDIMFGKRLIIKSAVLAGGRGQGAGGKRVLRFLHRCPE